MKLLLRHGGTLLLFLLLPLSACLGQSGLSKVAGVVITNVGPQAVGEAMIRANIHVKPGDAYLKTSVDNDVRNLYATGFFRYIQVADKLTDDGVVITYILQGKYRLTGINYEGNTKFSDSKIKKKVTSRVGDPLDERKLFLDTQEIQKLYEKAGYNHTVVKYEVNNIDNNAGRASVTFTVQETPKVKIIEVDFTGAHAFTLRKLRHVIKTRKRWMFSWITGSGRFKEDQFADDQETLKDFYRNEGYIDFDIKAIKITNPTPRTMKIEFVVSEGTQYKVGSVSFKGNQIFSATDIVAGLKRQHVANRSKYKIGEHGLEADASMTFKPEALVRDRQAVEDFYGSRGYINSRAGRNPKEFDLRVVQIPNTESGTMDLEYRIEEGEKSYIEKIQIRGNVKTKDKVIRRELSVSPGDVFDMVRVRLSKDRLQGLGFFEKVDTKIEPTDVPNHKDLIVGVDEKRTATVSVGAGYDTIESLVGYAELSQVDFDLFNPPYFTGGGQKFRLKVTLGLQLQDYEVSFVEPWFLNKKLIFSVDLYRQVLNYQSLNNLYNESFTGVRLGLTRALGSDFLIGSIHYTLQNVGIVSVNTNAPATIARDAGNTLQNRFGTALTYDTRNNVELPNKGQQTTLSAEAVVGDRDYLKLELKSAWYFPGFAKGHVIEVGGKAGVAQKLSSDDVPFFDRYYLGGQNTLRGFDYRGVGPRETTVDGRQFEPIGGDTFWLATAEYSIPIIDRLRIAFFYDIGNVSARPFSNSGYDVYGRTYAAPTLDNPFSHVIGTPLVGNTGAFSDNYGIGLRLNLPIGPLRLDYGIPIHRDDFNGSSGKFQFGVGFSRPL